MAQVVGILNSLLTRLFDALLWPFRGLHPIWALLAVSSVTGLVMLWIFGKVSDQEAVRAVRDKIRGNLIGVRLFGDDIRVMFRLQGTILRATLTIVQRMKLVVEPSAATVLAALRRMGDAVPHKGHPPEHNIGGEEGADEGGEGAGQEGPLEVQPVFGLVKDHGIGRLCNLIADLVAPVRRQAVHDLGLRGMGQQFTIDLEAFEVLHPLLHLGFLAPLGVGLV